MDTTSGEPVPLFDDRFPLYRFGPTYSLAPDCRFVLAPHSGEPNRMEIVLNWLVELEELVPAAR